MLNDQQNLLVQTTFVIDTDESHTYSDAHRLVNSVIKTNNQACLFFSSHSATTGHTRQS